jgi:hypothetical protein
MPPETVDLQTVNWGKVYRRSHRPIGLRGFSVDYLTIRAVGLLLILLCALVFPGIQINWDWASILIYLAILAWLGWILWPVIENRWTSRLVFKARVERKLEAQFWQREMRPIIIVIQKAFRITSQGNLIEANGWIGHQRVNIPAWLSHTLEEQEKVDLVCLSTRRILGKLEEFSRP